MKKNNTYKSLLTSATNTITTLRTDLNAANNKLSQVSDAQYNAKLQQDLAIQLLSQSHQSNIQYLQERLNLNFSQDEMRYSEQTGVDKRQNEIINELLSYHTVTISRGTPTQTQDISSNVLGMIDIPYNEEYMYIYDTNDENNINNDTLLVNAHYLHDILCLYYPLNSGGDISSDISTIGNGKLILFRVIYNDMHYYYYYSVWIEKPEALPSPWPSGDDSNWISFKSLNANSTIAQLYYGTCPISWGSTPQTIPQYSAQSTAVNTATEVQVPTGTETQTQTTPTQAITLGPTLGPTETQTQTTPTQVITLGPTLGPTATLSHAQTTPTQTINTQTINTETMPAGPTRTIAPTATESQAPTETQAQTTPTQTINTRTLPISGAPVTHGRPAETEVQVPTATETQTQTTPTIAPTIGPTGRPAGHVLPLNDGYQYVYEGMTGVNIKESSIYVNPAIYSNLPKDLILIKHSDESYEYCDFIGICPDGVLSGYYIYNIRIDDTSNIVTEAPLPAPARPTIPAE